MIVRLGSANLREANQMEEINLNPPADVDFSGSYFKPMTINCPRCNSAHEINFEIFRNPVHMTFSNVKPFQSNKIFLTLFSIGKCDITGQPVLCANLKVDDILLMANVMSDILSVLSDAKNDTNSDDNDRFNRILDKFLDILDGMGYSRKSDECLVAMVMIFMATRAINESFGKAVANKLLAMLSETLDELKLMGVSSNQSNTTLVRSTGD